MNLFTKQKQTQRLRAQTYAAKGKEGGKGASGSLGWTCTHCCTQNG